jgi:hypothetical protein
MEIGDWALGIEIWAVLSTQFYSVIRTRWQDGKFVLVGSIL